MPLPIPGLSDLLTVYDRLFNRLVLELEACGPCQSTEFLSSVKLKLPDNTLLQLRRELPSFMNVSTISSTPNAAELIMALDAWRQEHGARLRARKLLRRMIQRLALMEDATSIEKARFIVTLLNRNASVYRPVTQVLAAAALDPAFAPVEPAASIARPVARVVYRPDDENYAACGIYVMNELAGILATHQKDKADRLKLAAEVISTFSLEPLKSLLTLALNALQRKIDVYEQEAPTVERAIERGRPLLVRFKVLLPAAASAPSLESEPHLCVLENGFFPGRKRNGSPTIKLDAVVDVESGKKARFAQHGEYYCLSVRPLHEIRTEWDQAQRAFVQLRLRSRTTGLIRRQWLRSAVKPTRAILPA